MGHSNFFDILFKKLRDLFNQSLELFFSFFLMLFFLGVLQVTQIKFTFSDVLELLSVELCQVTHQPFIDPIVKQDNFQTFLPENLKMWTIGSHVIVLCRHIIDLLLLRFHSLDVGF